MFNNVFFNNIAEIAGGAIFTCEKSLHNYDKYVKSYNFKNNRANSYGNDTASFPNVILLNGFNENGETYTATSGIPFSLTFNLHDQYNQPIKDHPRFISNFLLKADLSPYFTPIFSNSLNNNNIQSLTNNAIANFFLENNECFFLNGQCHLQNLKIIANPNNYHLHFSIFYDDFEVTLAINELIVTIEECDKEYAKKIDEHNIIYCEKPACNMDCINGECKFSENSSSINNYVYNTNDTYCHCFDGYEGDICNTKIFHEVIITKTNIINYQILIIIKYYLYK